MRTRSTRWGTTAMIGGVCNGLAAFLSIDVTIVRIIFVILAVITKGVGAAVYGGMMFVIPQARTSEEHAEAQGLPFNAQEVIDQAKKHFADFNSNKEEWKREWRRTWPQMFWWREGVRNVPYAVRVLAGMTVPILGLFTLLFWLAYFYVPDFQVLVHSIAIVVRALFRSGAR